LFLIIAVAYLFWTHVVMGHLRPIARVCVLGICLCGLVMAATAVWSLKSGGGLWPLDAGEVWPSVRGAVPEREGLRRLYFMYRVYITTFGVVVMLILTWLGCSAVGLT
jgi:hypothetical protein